MSLCWCHGGRQVLGQIAKSRKAGDIKSGDKKMGGLGEAARFEVDCRECPAPLK